MTKDVLVSVTGVHAMDGDNGNVEVITTGNYYFKNGRHYVIYDEIVEGIEGNIRSTIKIGDRAVDVIKTGNAKSHIVFELEKKNISCYATPFGQIMIGVNTNNIEIQEEEDIIQVNVDYTLDINYERASHCRLTMNIQSKSKAEFHLGS